MNTESAYKYLFLITIMVAAGVSATVALAWAASQAANRATPPDSSPRPAVESPLPVQTTQVRAQQTFELRHTFAGQVQARRESALGFEAQGRLARVLVEEGDRVSAGTVLAELDTALLEARRAELLAARDQAQADLSLANATFTRMRGIVDRGGVSRQRLDEARDGQRAALAALELARRRVQSIDISLVKARLVAPFDGVVISRMADEGRVLGAGEPVISLQEHAKPEIRVGVAGRLVDRLEPGSLYELHWQDTTLVARLRVVLPLRASRTRTVDALFDPVSGHAALRSGDTVTLRLAAQVSEPGSWLPMSALTEGERGLWNVYVAEAAEPHALPAGTHRVMPRSVEVIHQESDRVYVSGSLSPKDLVVTTGLQRIVPGQLVSTRPTSANAG